MINLIIPTPNSYLEVKMQNIDILRTKAWPVTRDLKGLHWQSKQISLTRASVLPSKHCKIFATYPRNMSLCLIVGRVPMICLDIPGSVYSGYMLQKWFPKEMIDAFYCSKNTIQYWRHRWFRARVYESVLLINLVFNTQNNVLANNKMWLYENSFNEEFYSSLFHCFFFPW